MTLAGARLFHVNVNCTDLTRSHAFYVSGLGLAAGCVVAAIEMAVARRGADVANCIRHSDRGDITGSCGSLVR
jgi:catechol 2,3-dioxygenase-like lactoylglutathione lyase family enzyme